MTADATAAMVIRPGQLAEAAAILALWRAADATPSVTDHPGDVERILRGAACLLLVAELGGRLIGTVIGGFDGWRGFLYRLAVDPAHRRCGVARRLVAEIERDLRRRGAVRITALVERDHPWATAFWTAVGYRDDAGIARYVRDLGGAEVERR